MPLSPGSRIGPYVIADSLGAGGMGEVYRARDTKLNRDVALKVIPDAFALDPDRLARFQREAQVLAALNHPHIGAIYGFEDSGETHALVLELVDGETLADRVSRGTMPLDEALPIARQISAALEAAHEHGIVHRDLKPANIKVTPDGTVKVLDFGLAKLAQPEAASGRAVTMSPTITSPVMLTGIGMILGTAAYMAPEQAKGRDADKRSDIWAFGCVLYEMLTGQGPFTGDDVSDTLANVLKRELDFRVMPSDVPPAIVTLVQRCLVKDRRERISDMAVVQFLLSEHAGLASAGTGPFVAPPIAATRLSPIAAAVLLTALVVGAGAWLLRPAVAPSPMVRFTMSLPDGQQFTNLTRQVLAISPDGTRLVYAQGSQLNHRALGELEAQVIPGTNGLGPILPVFSPDGSSIAFFALSDGTLKRIPVNGGTPQTIARVGNPLGMSWGENGIVFGGGSEGILRVSPKGGVPEQLVRVDKDQSAYGPQILPGGKFVLFSLATGIASDRWDTADIVVQSLTSGERKTIIAGGSEGRYLSSGHLVYAVSGSLFAVAFDPSTLTIGDATASVLTGVGRASPPVAAGTAKFSVSDTGSLVYAAGPADTRAILRTLVVSDRNGKSVPLKNVAAGQYTHPRVSPDGARVAVGRDEGKNSHVWIYELAGTSAMRRLTLEGRNQYPVWSGDGLRVAFQSDRQGDPGIFSQSVDGRGDVVRLTTPPKGTAHVPESWSPDSKHLLFTEQNGSAYVLFSLSIDDKMVTPFGSVRSSAPIGAGFSPDGRWVTFAEQNAGLRSPDSGVFIQSFPTGTRYPLPKMGIDFHPVWSADGKELFYVAAAARPYVAVTVRTEPVMTFSAAAELSEAIPKPRLTFPDARGYDVTPDGKFIGLIPVASPDVPGPVSRQEIGVILNWYDELKRLVPAN